MGLDQYLYVSAKNYDETFYYRKENWLRNWMINNTKLTHRSNCEGVEITTNQIKELLNLCEQVLKNKDDADELLPTLEGFFFGNTVYDEWYFKGVKHLKHDLETILSHENEGLTVTYEDWW